MNLKSWFNLFIGASFGLFFALALVRFGMSVGSDVGTNSDTPSFADTASAAEIKGNSQVVKLGYSGTDGNYSPSVIRLKKGIPVELIMDTNTLRGCMSALISPELGVQGVARPGNNIIKFTPRETGQFAFSCPMGMGSGTFIVES